MHLLLHIPLGIARVSLLPTNRDQSCLPRVSRPLRSDIIQTHTAWCRHLARPRARRRQARVTPRWSCTGCPRRRGPLLMRTPRRDRWARWGTRTTLRICSRAISRASIITRCRPGSDAGVIVDGDMEFF
ncbi:hypothetical protein FA95DRAFT_715877 [Auriscalpium vulgare]|uniref:Uncharacterized protein n=1 Tax=Auriscalpium vulgare TaxID=40419 RepID=A0ACB8RCB8_9AGAM|nr:hypothetical protein FA95DRAFT_715877 [Auriscalpium vulgare]